MWRNHLEQAASANTSRRLMNYIREKAAQGNPWARSQLRLVRSLAAKGHPQARAILRAGRLKVGKWGRLYASAGADGG